MAMLSLVRRFRGQEKNQKITPCFVIGRDSHKSVYDGLRLSDAAAIMIPCDTDPDFEVSLGMKYESLFNMISQRHDEVRIIFSQFY